MKKVIIGLFTYAVVISSLGFTTRSFSQTVNDGMLPEIEIHFANYKYLNSVENAEMDLPVKLLERKVANFDITSLDLYQEDYEYYNVSFYIPNGQIVASYDKDGNLTETIEKFVNIDPPESVLNTVRKRYPGWLIYKDVYKVRYHKDKGSVQKFKLILENGGKHIRVSFDENGEII
jgi:hypothetical protein